VRRGALIGAVASSRRLFLVRVKESKRIDNDGIPAVKIYQEKTEMINAKTLFR
jgi:hypothetical protein